MTRESGASRFNPVPGGVPSRLLEPVTFTATVTKKIAPELIELSERWDGTSNLLVFGPTGVGKSWMLAHALHRMHAARQRVVMCKKWLWWRADELAQALRDRGGYEEVEKAKTVPLLIIDEMGWEPFYETLAQVIGKRADLSGKTTAATSGLRLEQFVKRYGDALLRKLTEPGGGGVVDVWGKR